MVREPRKYVAEKVSFTTSSLLSCGVTQISPEGRSLIPLAAGVEQMAPSEFLCLNPDATSLNEATLPKESPS